MKSPSNYALDCDGMIHVVLIIIIFLFGAQRQSSFSKVFHHLGVYFLRFVGLLYGESGVKAYPEDHVCVQNSLLRELSSWDLKRVSRHG